MNSWVSSVNDLTTLRRNSVMENDSITIKCLQITQPIGSFYIGVMSFGDLVRISYADVRRLERERRDVESYLGIERPLSAKRVEELKRYVNTLDATFPTGVILAISSEHAEFDPRAGQMRITAGSEIAKIIDGQHRIAGLEGFDDDTFQMNVVIFIDMDIEDQAMVFATINLAQTKVSKSLAYDLYEYTRTRSPQKSAHNIARLLNSREESPFHNRIKILGTADPQVRRFQILTQAAFVEALIRMISGSIANAHKDRDDIKRRKKLTRLTPGESTTLVFRDMFIDERDAEIARVIWNYFTSVQQRWPQAWADVKRGGSMLPRTNGFRALMRLLPTVYRKVGGPDGIPNIEDFLDVLKEVELRDEDFATEKYRPGTSGESQLYEKLLRYVETGVP